jgi:hypothetical protein
VSARVSTSESSAVVLLHLLLDSGADVSVIPRDVALSLRATIQPGTVPTSYLRGEIMTFDQAWLAVEFDRFRFQGPFLLVESEYGVLGRNVLNRLVLTLDGPKLSWRIGSS